MSWQGLEGHDEVIEQFRRRLAAGRMASTYLFVGPPGVGKRTMAHRLARALLCQRNDEKHLDPCGQCPSCIQAAADTHPDILTVAKPADRAEIPVSLLIGPKEHRMQEGLCHDLSLRPFMSHRRIAIIDDADALNEEGANALLKTLEEPPPGSLLILIGTSADRQLPTIRSRSQLVRFRPLEEALLARLIIDQGIASEQTDAQRLARLSDGSLQRARELADPAWDAFCPAWLELLAGADWDSVRMARSAIEFVDAGGKEASARRTRARLVVDCTIGFYRQLARGLAGASTGEDQPLAQAAARAAVHWRWDAEAASACIDRSLEALEQIDRNAYLPLVVECWIDELGQLTQGRPVMVWER